MISPVKTYSTNELKNLPLHEITHTIKQGNDREQVVKDFIKRYALKGSISLLQQLMAYFPRELPVKYDAEGKACFQSTLAPASKDDFVVGLWYLATSTARGELMTSQNKYPEVAAYVPLILGGYKKFSNVSYSSWTQKSLKGALDYVMYNIVSDDYGLMCLNLLAWHQNEEDWKWCSSVDKLQATLNVDVASLSLQTPEVVEVLRLLRSRIPSTVNLMTALKGLGTPGTPLSKCSSLGAPMLLQTWLAHPNTRTKYMILDPTNLDSMPEPLESVDRLFAKPKEVDESTPSVVWSDPDSTIKRVRNAALAEKPKRVAKVVEDAPPWMT